MAITPGGRVGDASPLAKPGYRGKRKLSDYEREVAHALMRKGHSKKRAIAMARGIIRNAAVAGRWGRGKASGRVRAGAAASIAQRKSFSSTGGKLLDMTDPRALAVALVVAKERGMTIDLVGPKGYEHGWRFVGVPGGGVKIRNSRYGKGKSRMQIERVGSVTRSKGKTPKLEENLQVKADHASDIANMATERADSALIRGEHAVKAHDKAVRAHRAAAEAHARLKTSTGDDEAAVHRRMASDHESHLRYAQTEDPFADQGGMGEARRAAAGHGRHSVKVQKRGENHHVVHTVDGKSRTVAKYKDPEEAKAHAARVAAGASALNQIRDAAESDKPVKSASAPTDRPGVRQYKGHVIRKLSDGNYAIEDSNRNVLAVTQKAAGAKLWIDAHGDKASPAGYPAGDRLLGASTAKAVETNLGPTLHVGNDTWTKGSDGTWRHRGTEGYGGHEFARATPGRKADASGVHATPAEAKKLDQLYANNIQKTHESRVRSMSDTELRGASHHSDPQFSAAARAERDRRMRESGSKDGLPEPPDPTNPKDVARTTAAAQAYVGRASDEQLKAMLADKRYASWRGVIEAELANRHGGKAPSAPPTLVKTENAPISSSDEYRVKEGSVKAVRVNGEIVGYVARGKVGSSEMSRHGNYRTGRWISQRSGYLIFDARGRRVRGPGLAEPTQDEALKVLMEHHGKGKR